MIEYEDVCVVAGGWSASRVNLNKLPGFVIAVNDAAIHLPNTPDCIVSMDRIWSENRWPWLCEQKIQTWLRRSAAKNLDTSTAPWLRIFDCDYRTVEFADASETYPVLNGTHSGACAINRAYQLKPRRCWLIGFDMREGPRGEKHWYKPYDWATKGGTVKKGLTPSPSNLAQWATEFGPCYRAFLEAKVDVVNVSNWTRVTAFPIISADRFNAMW